MEERDPERAELRFSKQEGGWFIREERKEAWGEEKETEYTEEERQGLLLKDSYALMQRSMLLIFCTTFNGYEEIAEICTSYTIDQFPMEILSYHFNVHLSFLFQSLVNLMVCKKSSYYSCFIPLQTPFQQSRSM